MCIFILIIAFLFYNFKNKLFLDLNTKKSTDAAEDPNGKLNLNCYCDLL